MFDERVEKRLGGWARWCLDIMQGNEGYPKQSIICLFADGFALRGEFKSIPLITNEKAQQMDFWLGQMKQVYPDYWQAIVLYYLTNKTPSDIAQSLHVSRRTFHQRIQGAKTWLSGCISRTESESYC